MNKVVARFRAVLLAGIVVIVPAVATIRCGAQVDHIARDDFTRRAAHTRRRRVTRWR